MKKSRPMDFSSSRDEGLWDAEQFPLLFPVIREAFAEFTHRERFRFRSVQDHLNDVRGEVHRGEGTEEDILLPFKIIKCLQDQVEYLLEKNRIYEEIAVALKSDITPIFLGKMPKIIGIYSLFGQKYFSITLKNYSLSGFSK